MAQYNAVLTKTVVANTGITAHRFVNFEGGQVSNAGVKALGVALHDADEGEAVAVVVLGTAVVETGGSVGIGDYVASDAEGRAVRAGAGQVILGIALEDATGAGEDIEVLLASPVATAV